LTARWLYLLLLGVYLTIAGGHLYSSDEVTMFATAWQLAHGRGLALAASPEERLTLSLCPGADGRWYGQYPAGQPLLAVPLVWAGELAACAAAPQFRLYLVQLAVSLFNQLLTPLVGVTVFGFACALGAGARRALLLALAVGLASPLLPYSKTFFSEPLLALLVLAAARQLAARRWLAGGILLAVAPLVKFAAVLFYPPLLVYAGMLAGRERWRAWWRMLVPLAAAAAVGLALNTARFGAPLASGYHHNPDFGFAAEPWVGLAGLTVSPGRGLLVYWPLAIIALAALPAFSREHRAEFWLVATAGLTNLLFYGWWLTWAKKQSWRPRYLVPLVPLLALPLVAWRPRRWGGTALLAGLSLLVQLAGVAIYHNAYYAAIWEQVPPAQRIMGPRYLHDVHFRPELSPVLGHARLLADRAWPWAVAVGRGREPVAPSAELVWLRYQAGTVLAEPVVYAIPSGLTPLYSWFWLPVPDFVWCYLPFTGLSPLLAGLVLLPLALAVLAAWQLCRNPLLPVPV